MDPQWQNSQPDPGAKHQYFFNQKTTPPIRNPKKGLIVSGSAVIAVCGIFVSSNKTQGNKTT